ncbi:hypothetical protein Acsp06_41910 [Actinomycetospora sp. NBRC 106375]|uniref:hypothetical protein n=1 Tax=Actinomycetospora sp. NBRC 106375 TaxID=3032207 RepID=UPI0024A1A6D9|nr:hypothetical protein [Actinomycetospora sp. NBRC 106375]GLZ48006.1 hypothetical protein Acsp06_41910 [Actinomycetospora sp. NBRC 106375]
MPRRSRRPARPAPAPPPLRGGWVREEDGWMVRSISGTAATKTYRCPGCQQEIPPGTSHVVAWPADEVQEDTDRRHWHTGCWRQGRR